MEYAKVMKLKWLCKYFHSKHGIHDYWYCVKCKVKIKKKPTEMFVRQDSGPG